MTSITNRNSSRSTGRAAVAWLILVAIVILAWAVTWGMKSIQCSREIRSRTSELAQDTAHATAVFGSKQIIAGNWGDLQSYAEDLVGEKPLSYVAIVNTQGIAVVHTNAGLRDKPFEAPMNSSRMVSASVPVMNLTKQAATVWIGVNTGP